ncbi:Transcriptional adapter 1 [Desmophyllum pertusum]|uniref:Transcriptional adapter 1 n=1 Tax=Desmophyllum pertusum TaxID=174260 RepID=A0A9X0CR17_9CNID|nr:Transcriptional adapter 1 [Desmophyllum pertusum]
MAVDLSVARRQLGEALGDSSRTYWNNMKLWYKQKISKEEFDAQAKKCLGNDNLHFHNDFLLAILAKCQALGSTPAHPRTPQKLPPKPQLIKKGKIKKQSKKVLKSNFEQRFTPYDPLQGAPQLSLKVCVFLLLLLFIR